MVHDSRQAGDEKCDEVKVTPEMIEAGAVTLSGLRDDLADSRISLRDAALQVYCAMQRIPYGVGVDRAVEYHTFGQVLASFGE